MIKSMADLARYIYIEKPDIVYLSAEEFLDVMNDPAVLPWVVNGKAAEIPGRRIMGRPILLKPLSA